MRKPSPAADRQARGLRPADELDWAIEQLQREHARVFDAISRLRAASIRIRLRASPDPRRR